MATLSLANSEIVRATLQVMGLGRSTAAIAAMDAETEADLRAVIRSGLNRFYFPIIDGFVYQWRFLEKTHAIPAQDAYSTGTVAVSGGTVTLTGGTWPTDLTDRIIEVDGHVLFVTVRTSDTLATVSHSQLTVAAGATYEALKYKYDLPSDFGEWLGGVVYQDGSDSWTLGRSDESELRLRYAIGQGSSTATTHYAILSSPTASDVHEIMLWPIPETEAFIRGVYLSVPDDNLPVALTTPGSTVQVRPLYKEAVLEAVLAAAEEYNNDMNGVHAQRFEAALRTAIAHDKALGGAYDFSKPTRDYMGLGQVEFSIDFQ